MTKEEKRNIAWIGETMYLQTVINYLKRDGLDIINFRHANTGLEGLANEKFHLIVVNSTLAIGDRNILPDYLIADDYPEISCFFIRQVRKGKLNVNSTILVPHLDCQDYTPVRNYMKAGASECVDVFNSAFIQENDLYHRIKFHLEHNQLAINNK